jgi:hypothetical protein
MPLDAPTPEETKPSDGRFCFLDFARPCTAECVARLPSHPAGKEYEGQGWAVCKLLHSAHSLGQLVQITTRAQADRIRTQTPEKKR